MYVSQVVGYRENTVVVSCMGSFFLASDSEFVLLSSSSLLSSSLLALPESKKFCKGVLDTGLGSPPSPATFYLCHPGVVTWLL